MPKVYTTADISPQERERLGEAGVTALLADWNATEEARPMAEWMTRIAASDATLPRAIEDIIDRDGTDGLPPALVAKYEAKKAVRNAKPGE